MSVLTTKICDVENCNNISRSCGRGKYCELHYYRLRKYGTFYEPAINYNCFLRRNNIFYQYVF